MAKVQAFVCFFTPNLGEDEPISTSIFFRRMVQPPTSDILKHLRKLEAGRINTKKNGICCKNTLPRIKIAPDNGPSEKESSIPTIHFQVLC